MRSGSPAMAMIVVALMAQFGASVAKAASLDSGGHQVRILSAYAMRAAGGVTPARMVEIYGRGRMVVPNPPVERRHALHG